MLLTREEMTFSFGDARFDPVADREILGWIFSQSLFGEATGCYCGAALYGAPDIEAATFISRQAVEEFSHFRQFLRIFQMLGVHPQEPHRLMRLLTSHESLWDHHVALEMAIGEGWVLQVFYALVDTIDHPDIVRILTTIAKQEAGHVAFGEQQTMKAIQQKPWLRRHLLGMNLLSLGAIRKLGGVVVGRLGSEHPVLKQLPAFLEFSVGVMELRLQRLGLLDRPLKAIPWWEQAVLIAEAVVARQVRKLLNPERPRIPTGYLTDPVLVKGMADKGTLGEE